MARMTEAQMEQALRACFSELILQADQEDYPEGMPRELADLDAVYTFSETGLPQAGVTLRFKDGSEFALCITPRR